MLLNLVALFLGLIFGYVVCYGRLQSAQAEASKNEARASSLENAFQAAQSRIATLRSEKDKLHTALMSHTNQEDTIAQLVKERDEAREYAEKYHKRYKELLAQNEARELIRDFTGKVV